MTRDLLLAATIKQVVAAHFGLTEMQITSRKRPAHIVWPRHVAMSLTRNLTRLSLPQIGDLYWRDHGTVIHAINAVANRMMTNNADNAEVCMLSRTVLAAVDGVEVAA